MKRCLGWTTDQKLMVVERLLIPTFRLLVPDIDIVT